MLRLSVTQPGLVQQIHEFPVPSTVVIGRAAVCGCRLDKDPLVSRCHAVLTIRTDSVGIKDLGSLNGILINGVHYGGTSGRTMTQPHKLNNGDAVTIGETTIALSTPASTKTYRKSTRKLVRPEFHAGTHGRNIPGYLIEKVVGQGGMGIVYQARRLSSGRMVAIKTIHPDIRDNPRAQDHFLREIEVMKRVSHQNIVAFHGSGITTDNCLYLILEYVDGGDLSQLLERSPGQRLPVSIAHGLAMQVASGLAHAHERGIVHRDIKPKNILITADVMPLAKISDLGLAKRRDETPFLPNGQSGGTIAYMPPEQLTTFHRVAPSGDVFSVGATLYEMLTGRRPYDFTRGDRLRVVSRGMITPLASLPFTLPERLARVVDKCIAPRPEDRYRDCGHLLTALKKASPPMASDVYCNSVAPV